MIKKIKFYVDNVKRVEYLKKDKMKASFRMIKEMNDEALKIEDKLFLEYMQLKDRKDIFTKSQSILKISFVIKFLVFSMVAVA